jgi:flagellar motor switch protein FliN/FliY
MSSDSLSQEEINRILMGNAQIAPEERDTRWQLSADEKDALGEIGNICMGASATTLYELLNHRVSITTPRVSICTSVDQLGSYKKPFIAVEVSYTDGIYGKNVFLLKREDALMITDILIGGDGSMQSEGLEDMYLSAMSEVMNQMIGASSTALSSLLHFPINISPPIVKEIIMDEDDTGDIIDYNNTCIQICFDMTIENLLNSEIMQIIPFSFGKLLAKELIAEEATKGAEAPVIIPRITQPVQPEQAAQAQKPEPKPRAGGAAAEAAKPQAAKESQRVVEVKQMQYPSFDDESALAPVHEEEADNGNLNLLMDVPLNVTVELGRSVKSIKEILSMRMGSIVVLDRLAGEMVDILVNGKLFAKGEVAVIDENYGVRVTEIINKKGNLF